MIGRLAFSMLFLLTVFSTLKGQLKYEKEYRLSQEEVPSQALNFVKQLGFKEKIKWYKEEGFERTSIEAKTKHLAKKYSIEFSLNGAIEDIEIEIKQKELPIAIGQNIINYLNTNYQKVKICKIQTQYSGEAASLIQAVIRQDFKSDPKVLTRYEIVVKVKKEGKHQKLEYLFDQNGQALNSSVIILKNTDNLEY